jgi:ABC-type nitrate/sulfonate/bicarbonate transport system permease component
MTVNNVASKTTKRRSGTAVLKSVLLQAWLPVGLLVLIYSLSAQSTSFYFPSGEAVLSKTWQIWFPNGLVSELVPSLLRVVVGFSLALVLGIGLGVILGVFRSGELAARPLTETLRAIPGVALLPISMMFFGTGESMKLVMIVFVSMWPIVLTTIDGVRSVDPALKSVMDAFKLRPQERFRHVYLPAAMPQIFSGARISLAIAVAVMVAVEMYGTPGGIGYFIRNAQQTFKITDMWTGLLILGIFGYLLNIAFRIIENRVLGWHQRMVKHVQGAA